MKYLFCIALVVLAITGCHKDNTKQPASRSGVYLVTGFYMRYTPSGTDSTWVIYNDTLHVVENSDTSILINNEQLNFNSALSNDTVTVFGSGYHYAVNIATFYKYYEDSISTYFNSGVNGGMNMRKYGRRISM